MLTKYYISSNDPCRGGPTSADSVVLILPHRIYLNGTMASTNEKTAKRKIILQVSVVVFFAIHPLSLSKQGCVLDTI